MRIERIKRMWIMWRARTLRNSSYWSALVLTYLPLNASMAGAGLCKGRGAGGGRGSWLTKEKGERGGIFKHAAGRRHGRSNRLECALKSRAATWDDYPTLLGREQKSGRCSAE